MEEGGHGEAKQQHSLASVTAAGTLATAPAGIRATHWYRPTVWLLRAVMTRVPRVTRMPSASSDPLSSRPFRRQVVFTHGGSTTQPRTTVPPSFWTVEEGWTVTWGTPPGEEQGCGNEVTAPRNQPHDLCRAQHPGRPFRAEQARGPDRPRKDSVVLGPTPDLRLFPGSGLEWQRGAKARAWPSQPDRPGSEPQGPCF